MALAPPVPAAAAIDPLQFARSLRWRHYRWAGSLEPGEKRELLGEPLEGFLVFAILDTDNPDTRVVVDLYGDGTAEILLSPRYLYELGLTWWSNTAAFVSRYDDEARRYVAVFSPAPWMLFAGPVRAWIENPSGERANYDLHIWLWVRWGR